MDTLVSDAHREYVIGQLELLGRQGALSEAELSAKSQEVCVARTIDELVAVIADLPIGGVPWLPSSSIRRSRVSAGMRYVFVVMTLLVIGALVALDLLYPALARYASTALLALPILIVVIFMLRVTVMRRRSRPHH